MSTRSGIACVASLALIAACAALSSETRADAPQGTCGFPTQDVRPLQLAATAYPAGAATTRFGEVVVDVTIGLSNTGTVTSATIAKPGPSDAFNRAALLAAKSSTFAPKIVNCIGVPSNYTFVADFMPPTHTSTPACKAGSADQPVRATNLVPPAIPDLGDEQRTATDADVMVEVSETGKIESVTLEKSSGVAAADDAILKAVRASTFAPRISNCKPAQGWYVLVQGIAPD